MSLAVATSNPLGAPDGRDLFFGQLGRSAQRVLLLDYDGTIAPFCAQRNSALPYSTVPELLDSIITTCSTRVVLITGRTALEIPPLLRCHPHPEIWGSYGVERLRADGRYDVAPLSDQSLNTLAKADAWLEQEGLSRLVEIKPGAVAVHWRGLTRAEAEEARTAAYRVLSPLALESRLLLAEFDGGLELRDASCSKGDVVRMVLAEHGPAAAAAYLGDDASDEDAFRVLNGRGFTVLVRSTYRFTAAQAWIRPPEQLLQFLADWVRACGGDL